MAEPLPHLAIVGSSSGHSGVPSYIRQLCRALEGRARITVLSDGDGPGYDFVRSMRLQGRIVQGLSRSAGAGQMAGARARLGAELTLLQPDLVWAHSFWPIFLTRALAIRGAPWRLIVTSHGPAFGPGRRAVTAALTQGMEQHQLNRCPPHDILCVGARDRDTYARMTQGRHRLWHVPNCSDLGVSEPLLPLSEPPRIVMTSRLARQKNLGLAARLMAHLPGDIQLHLYGAGTDTPGARRLFSALPGARVQHHGAVNRAGVARALRGADLFLMTSRYEGMPIGALEGFEAGLPLALTDVGGTREILGAHPLGLMVDPADLPATAARIATALQKFRSERMALSHSIRAVWARQFSPTVWQPQMQALFETILAQPMPKD